MMWIRDNRLPRHPTFSTTFQSFTPVLETWCIGSIIWIHIAQNGAEEAHHRYGSGMLYIPGILDQRAKIYTGD